MDRDSTAFDMNHIEELCAHPSEPSDMHFVSCVDIITDDFVAVLSSDDVIEDRLGVSKE
jgi:hypothetical protein